MIQPRSLPTHLATPQVQAPQRARGCLKSGGGQQQLQLPPFPVEAPGSIGDVAGVLLGGALLAGAAERTLHAQQQQQQWCR